MGYTRAVLSCEQLEQRRCLSAVSFVAHDIVLNETNPATTVFAADLDNDGDVDVLSASFTDDKIAWYENLDGKGSFSEQKLITMADGAGSVHAADIDGDGDVDVLGASVHDNTFGWYENTDSKGTFGEQKVITSTSRSTTSVYAADIDGDGDVDVISASSSNEGHVAWYENTDGTGRFGPRQIITTEVKIFGPQSVYAEDVDGDGDVDVLSASFFDGKIAWYENTDGMGTFGPQKVISRALGAQSVYAADVDGDGDVDVFSASWSDNLIAWYENTDGQGSFGPQQTITTDAIKATSVYAADVDGDGDVDVLSASFEDNKIAWYENTDGRGTFGPQEVITTDAYRAQSVYAADINGDGNVDVLSASFREGIIWFEQQPPASAGDANRDLQFNQQDIVQVLQVAKFLTGERATFEEGDWNFDGVFDRWDIVAALQTGNYLQGPYASLAKSDRDADVDAVFDEAGLQQLIRPG